MKTKNLLAGIGVALLVLGFAWPSAAQTAYTPNINNVGLPEYGVFSGGSVDSVQLQNGNLHVDIPLLHLPGIGKDTDIHFVYDNLLFNSTTVNYGTSQLPMTWQQITMGRNGFAQVSDPLRGVLKVGTHQEQWQCLIEFQYQIVGPLTHIDYMAFTDTNGTGHNFSIDGYETNNYQACVPGNFYPANSYSGDATGYNLTLNTANGAVVSLTDKHGTQYTLGPGGGSGSVGTTIVPVEPVNPYNVPPSIATSIGPTALTYQQVIKVEDSDGNTISYGAQPGSPLYSQCQSANAQCFTDTVGRTIMETYPTYPLFNIPGMAGEANANEPQTISYVDQNNTTQTITINYSPYTLDLPSVCGGTNPVVCGLTIGTSATTALVGLPTSIVLQNGDTYTISYLTYNNSYCTPLPTTSWCTLGEISSITLPTGGVISYTWGALGGIQGGIVGRQVVSRTVTANGQSSTWQYPYSNTNIKTVTDPNLNDTVYTFDFSGGAVSANSDCGGSTSSPVVAQEVSYNGPQSANNPIATKNISYSYYGTSGFGSPNESGIFLPTSNVLTWNSNGATTETDTTYDNPVSLGGGGCSVLPNNVASRGNVVSKTVYDYGSGAHGAMLSNTQYSYLHNQNSSYAAANIADRVSQVSVYNGSGALAAQTTTNYDGFSQSAQSGLAAPGWSTNHDAGYSSAYTLRGLPTSVTKCSGPSSSPCSTSITTYTDYNILGQPTVSTDGLGYSTTVAYSTTSPPPNTDSDSAFFITTTMPSTTSNGWAVPHVTTQYQDVNTGLMIAKSDQNKNLTEQTYDDRMRPWVTTRPDNSTTTNIYPTPNQVITTVVENPSPNKVTTTNLDGMGRKISVSTNADSDCGSLTVNTSYDLLSRVSAVSNPHCNSSQATDGWTQYNYDAIGRLTSKFNPDNTYQQWIFNGNVVNFYDESQNLWTRTYNAESWLTQVLEPSGSTSSTTPLETDYGYDTLGNLLRVDQWGGPSGSAGDHVRNFTYDAVSRLIASNNPESASPTSPASQSCTGASGSWTTCYIYDNNSNLISKTDNRGISINYSYDPLNRLLGKTYSDSTPPVSFTYDASSISGNANDIGELTQATVQSGSTVLAQTSTYAYDTMGRLLQEQQCTPANCGISTYNLSYAYDQGGKPISATFPSNAPTSSASSGGPVTLAYTYDNAERLVTVGSSWSDSTTHPATLFQASSNSSAPGYGPMGLQNASLGVTVSNTTTATLLRAYDNRGRIDLEEDGPGNAITTGADSSGSITISGTEGSVTKANTSGSAILTVTGSEQTTSSCTTAYVFIGNDTYVPVTTCTQVPATGGVSVTVQGFTSSANYGGGSTTATLASALAAGFNVSGSPVTAAASGGFLTITALTTGSASNYTFSTSSSSNPDFTVVGTAATSPSYSWTQYGVFNSTGTFTGGWNAGTYYDAGTITAAVSDTTAQVNWVQGSTPASLASSLAIALNSIEGIPNTSCPTASQISAIGSDDAGFVTACASGGTITLTSVNGGPETDWSVTASAITTNPTYFSASGPNSCSLPNSGTGCFSGTPSFSVAAINMGGGGAGGETAPNIASGTGSTGVITVSGTETGPFGSTAATSGSGVLTVGGSDGTYQVCSTTYQCVPSDSQCWTRIPNTTCNTYPDTGSLSVTIGNFTSAASYNSGSTGASIATLLTAGFNNSNSPVTAVQNGSSITVTAKATGTASNYPITISNGDFWVYDPNSTLTGGSGGTPVYDAGTATATITSNAITPPISYTATVNWGQGDTSSTVAARLASAINSSAGSIVTATPSGSSINLASTDTGPMTNYAVTVSVADTQTAQYPSYFPSPSFAINAVNMTGGAQAPYTGPQGLLYSYSIALNGGYDGVGNLKSVTDSVTGTWNYSYDNLNRLVSGTSSAGYYSGAQMSWSYDPFGNRLNQLAGGTADAPMPLSSTASYTAASNQVSSSSQNNGAGFLYDAAGDVTYDGLNQYLYDAEGRLCAAMTSGPSLTGYLYDAGGTRVAKGSLTSFSCNFAANGFTPTASYVLGPGGEQVTEYAVSGPAGNYANTWQHTNAFSGGKIQATYHDTGTYFYLGDWLGTKRVEVGASGCATGYTSLAYGDGLTIVPLPGFTACASDATEHHFTGKERDAESGNDYFGARYYASSMGRFMSPDPGPYKWRDPQTLNRYTYTRNNPLKFVDPTGMYFVIDSENEQARQAISMMLRSQTGRALVYSIAMEPRPTYVKQGRLPYEWNGNKISATKGLNESIYGNANGQGILAGTTVTIDWVNAALSANGSPLFWLILKAYAHEFSHTADKNAAPNWNAADSAGKAGDKDASGNPCAGGGTECGSAEALARTILAELGNPDSYTRDNGSDDEAGGIIDQGNREENGDPPFALNPNSSSGRQRHNGKFCPAEYSVCN
ncbi:MAG: RHS repeat-associated core domain-containing protein [Terracidiphilus sp.]